jgi:hypothetical protein
MTDKEKAETLVLYMAILAGGAARMTIEGCPRVLTKEQMITGLKSGITLVVDRRDAPELPELLEMERDGLVVSRLVEYDEQSSALKFRWKQGQNEG